MSSIFYPPHSLTQSLLCMNLFVLSSLFLLFSSLLYNLLSSSLLLFLASPL